MTHEQSNRYDELARIVDIVAKARYKANKRLTLHSSFAQFTLTFLSIGLIIIPLLDLGGFSVHYEPKYVQIMQIIFAVMILAYSLLLSMGRFETRAEKMLSCGIVLSRLMREIKPHKGTNPPLPDSTYDDIYSRYYDCLEKFENHKELDYHAAMTDLLARKGIPKHAGQKLPPYIWSVVSYLSAIAMRRLKVYLLWTVIYSHYFITIAAMYAWIFFMIYPTRPHP